MNLPKRCEQSAASTAISGIEQVAQMTERVTVVYAEKHRRSGAE